MQEPRHPVLRHSGLPPSLSTPRIAEKFSWVPRGLFRPKHSWLVYVSVQEMTKETFLTRYPLICLDVIVTTH